MPSRGHAAAGKSRWRRHPESATAPISRRGGRLRAPAPPMCGELVDEGPPTIESGRRIDVFEDRSAGIGGTACGVRAFLVNTRSRRSRRRGIYWAPMMSSASLQAGSWASSVPSPAADAVGMGPTSFLLVSATANRRPRARAAHREAVDKRLRGLRHQMKDHSVSGSTASWRIAHSWRRSVRPWSGCVWRQGPPALSSAHKGSRCAGWSRRWSSSVHGAIRRHAGRCSMTRGARSVADSRAALGGSGASNDTMPAAPGRMLARRAGELRDRGRPDAEDAKRHSARGHIEIEVDQVAVIQGCSDQGSVIEMSVRRRLIGAFGGSIIWCIGLRFPYRCALYRSRAGRVSRLPRWPPCLRGSLSRAGLLEPFQMVLSVSGTWTSANRRCPAAPPSISHGDQAGWVLLGTSQSKTRRDPTSEASPVRTGAQPCVERATGLSRHHVGKPHGDHRTTGG